MQKNVTKAESIALILVLGLLITTAGLYKIHLSAYAGSLDAVSSVTENGECRLMVVADREWLNDKKKMADTVMRMCRENTFRSLKLSVDKNGYPSSLVVDVYLNKRDVGKKVPVCCFWFKPRWNKDLEESPNIMDDLEKYELYIDGSHVSDSRT